MTREIDMEGTLADNALEIAIIGGLIAVIVAFITIGAIFVFRLFNRVDQLADKLGETNERIGQTRNELTEKIDEKVDQLNRELSEKIDQRHREVSEKIDQRHREVSEKIEQSNRELTEKIDRLREDMMQQMALMKTEIINALVNHSHPEPGGPPVFTAPPPIVPPDPTARETEATPADD